MHHDPGGLFISIVGVCLRKNAKSWFARVTGSRGSFSKLHFSGKPASSRKFNCRPPANYFGRAGALRKLTRSPMSVAFRVGQGMPNS